MVKHRPCLTSRWAHHLCRNLGKSVITFYTFINLILTYKSSLISKTEQLKMKASMNMALLLITPLALSMPAPVILSGGGTVSSFMFTPAARGSCGGGTGFCTNGRCLCSSICEGICQWYECGKC
ncbi:hypothetical protein QBC40DRAFT_279147 [Triangularia verruculosa]|uniref:Uncharacterized protein n=1 Tax=Triangularia verruculosa TaxID=2587418 RepID=A0AAN6XM04_9PEZI|nr:hypothetical protein QBC40DRAFT_279147 [Triangularia verruculosa]